MIKTTGTNLDKLLRLIKSYDKKADEELLKKAYLFSEKCHKDEKRKNGDPYFTHPYAVAMKLAEMEMDDITICAGLLHDVLENCDVVEKEIERVFGSEISLLVTGVTKLGEVEFDKAELSLKDMDEQKRLLKRESLRKMFLAMAKDIRVVLIKLADRYHNLMTLDILSEKAQKRIAQETMEIYVPLADRLGMGKLKADLEDLAFLHLMPEEFKEIEKNTQKIFFEKEKYIREMKKSIRLILETEHLKAEIDGRAKHYYSIYKKMKKEKDFSKIYDLMAIRIIVPTVTDCYKALGIIHSMYKPLIYRIKDFIAVPKPNGYQSLHTTVFGENGKITEIQIRTEKMHEEAEKGVAAHWHYDETKHKKDYVEKKASFAPLEKTTWIKDLLEWQESAKNTDEFLEGLKIDIFKDRIFVFSPKGEIFDLPEGATPVDFAYAVHGWLGDHISGARVSGKMVPISEKLENRDIVEIVTVKNSKGPKRDWLNFVVTSRAKQRIKACLNKEG